MKKMLKLILAMTLMISSFATGVFAEENESEKSSSVSVSIRKADVQLDADLIGELPFTEGLVVEANAPIFVPENSKQVVERVEIQFTDEEGNMNSFYLPDRRYESTDSKILLRKENYAYINPILAGRYVVTVLVHMLDVTSPPPKPFVNAYQTEGVFEFEGTHKNVPTTSYVNVEEQGVRVGCDLSEAGCKEWLQALHYNSLNTSYLEISASGGSFTIPKQDSETPEYKSSEVFPYQDGDSEILVPALIITSVPIELGSKYEFSVHADGYFSRSKEVDSPFGSAPLDASKIEIVQIEKGADGEPALVISVPNSEEYRQWIYSINTLEFPDMGQCGIEDFTYSETEEKISYELPYHLSGGFGKTDENGITLGVMAPGYSTMYVNNVVLRYAYEQAPITDFSVAVKGSGIEISAMGPGGRAWLEALTVFKENLQYRPYIRMYANNMGNVTMIRLSNANANDDVLSKNNLTPESTEGTDENTVHTLFISAKSILKSGTMGAGNTVVNVMPNPYGYSQNPMLSNVSLYPMMKLVSETQNSVDNNTNIDTEVLDELDGYLKNNQISNVTVLVNEEDLRHNGNSKVELKGELTAMIVSDENGNYSVKDLDYDSVSMNMSTTIDDVKLTDEQIQEYVEILAETTTQMQTVYDNFGFDIKLEKEEKEMKDLAVATAITFELPEAIEVKDGDTLVLLTVHNGTAKYLPVVIMTDAQGNRTGIAYTSEFSSFVPVVLSKKETSEPSPKSCYLYYAWDGNDGIEIQCSAGVLDNYQTIRITYMRGEEEVKSFDLPEAHVAQGGFDSNGHKFVLTADELVELMGEIDSGSYNIKMSVYESGTNTPKEYLASYSGEGSYTYPERIGGGESGGDDVEPSLFSLYYANGSTEPDGFEIQGPTSAFEGYSLIQVLFSRTGETTDPYVYQMNTAPVVHPMNQEISILSMTQEQLDADENWPDMPPGNYDVTLRLFFPNPIGGPSLREEYALNFANGNFEYKKSPEVQACAIRPVDLVADADVIGNQNVTEGFVVDCGDEKVFASQPPYTLGNIQFSLNANNRFVTFRLPMSKYFVTESKLLMPKENMPLIDTTIPAGTYSVDMVVFMQKRADTCPPVGMCMNVETTHTTYHVSDSYTFESNHQPIPEVSISADDDGVKFSCAGAACRGWGSTLFTNAVGSANVSLGYTVNGSNYLLSFANTLEDKSQIKFAGDGTNYTITIPKDEILKHGISSGTTITYGTVSVYGYAPLRITEPIVLPFSSSSVDASKINVVEEVGADGEHVLKIISLDTSEAYESWMENLVDLHMEGTSRYVGVEGFDYEAANNQLVLTVPNHIYGALEKHEPMKLVIQSTGFMAVVKEVELNHLYNDYTPSLSVSVKAEGIEIHAKGQKGKDFLEALTVYTENVNMRPYVDFYASNLGLETWFQLKNESSTDQVLSINNLRASDSNHDENTRYSLLVPMAELMKVKDQFKTGNTPVRIRLGAYKYVANKMVQNVPLYPMLKLVSETQNSVDNKTNIDAEVLDELDGYLKNNQISNVTVLVNEEDLRHNGNSKVELKGELTAMIVSDEDGNYSVKDLDYDSVSMNMSTTIDDVKLTDEQIQEYVEILAETTTQMQTVYDNFGFDIKLHKEEKEMKDLAVATAISFELPEAIEVKDGDTLVLLTVHNGKAKYLPVVIMTDAQGNRTGIAYTSEFSSFVPVVLSNKSVTTAKDVPDDAEVYYDSNLGIVISSKDTEWLKGMNGFNMSSYVTWDGGEHWVRADEAADDPTKYIVPMSSFKGQYLLGNGKYTLHIQSENYYSSTFKFEVKDEVPEATVTYANDVVTVTTNDLDYLNALKESGQINFSSAYSGYLIDMNYQSSNGTEHYFDASNLRLETGENTCAVFVEGYEVIFSTFNYQKPSSGDAVLEMSVADDGSVVLVPTAKLSYSELYAQIFTGVMLDTGRKETGRFEFVDVNDSSNRYTHRKPAQAGGPPSGRPWYSLNGRDAMIPVDYLIQQNVKPGTYSVTYFSPTGPSYPLGTVTLTHSLVVDKPVPELSYEYKINKEELTITANDLDYLKNITQIGLTRGGYIYILYQKDTNTGSLNLDEKKNTLTYDRETLGALLSVRGNGTEGGEKFYSGSYILGIDSEGYEDMNASHRKNVNIYPAVVKNDKPVKDNKHGVHGKDHVCDYLHGHMVTYVEEVFDENYKNDGSSSAAADNAVRSALVASDISAEVVVTDNVNADNSALIANEMTGYTVVSEFEMNVLVTIDGVVQEGATINELDAALEYEMMIPENLPEVAEGYERQYNVVRVHEEDVDVLETTISENNKLEFESDLYSTYALVYRDVKKSSDEKEGVVDGYLYINGVKQLAYQLVNYQGDYYFVNDSHKLAMNTTLYLSERFVAGKTYSDGTALEVGYYSFDATGKMVIHNGPVGDYFYVNNIQQKAYQLVEYAGNYYFINDYHRLAKNVELYLGERFVTGKTYADGTPIEPGYFEFDETGKMIIKNGPLGDYFYVNNIQQKAYQLVEYAGNYYFINDYHKLAKATKLYLSEKFVSGKTYADGTVMQPGYYEFDETGKMVIHNGPAGEYFYVNNVMQKAYQLVEYEGHYYFINDCHKLAKSVKLYLGERFVTGKTYADGTPIEPGYFEFDETGKMIIKNGPVGDYFYVNNIQQKAYQLVEYHGNYYFINDAHKLAKNKKLYLSEKFVGGKTYADGTPIPAGLYEFDSEGKMINN